MSHFIITFRIKSDDDYQERYSTFTDRIPHNAIGGLWEETSSFYTFESDKTAAEICNDLWLRSGFDSSKDTMVVIDLDRREHATKGKVEYPNTLARCLGSTLN